MIYYLLGTLALGMLTGYILRILHEHNQYLMSTRKLLLGENAEEGKDFPNLELLFAVLSAFLLYLCAMFLIFPEVLK